ncbi:MAG: Holliday junction resolvase RuvX [Candidatus Sumerlaeia bacterium]|nr:Holliday junction resolvase RuvX [Candidatus Sumerlaeia bacterium]
MLALDVGDRWVGVALSRSRIVCEPLATIERKGRTQILDAVQRLVEEHRAGEVVLGLPLLRDGSKGDQAEKVLAFGRSLQRRLGRVPVRYQDERYTSLEAGEIRREAELGDRHATDALAAAIILRDYMDSTGGAARAADPPDEVAP